MALNGLSIPSCAHKKYFYWKISFHASLQCFKKILQELLYDGAFCEAVNGFLRLTNFAKKTPSLKRLRHIFWGTAK